MMLLIRFIALTASVEFALGGSCGKAMKDMRAIRTFDGQRIVGGQPARPNSHPWIVSLQQFGRHFCGGSLIRIGDMDETDIVLTASHCFYETRKDWGVTVTAGVNNLQSETNRQTVKVAKYFMHKHYNPQTVENDVCILKLETPIKFNSFVQPICLPSPDEQVSDNVEGIIAGWGYTEEDAYDTSNILMQTGIPVVNGQLCAEKHLNYEDDPSEIFPEIMICAGFEKGGNDSCQGDSGGPFVFKNGASYVLQGVVSFGSGCARAGLPGIYARVSKFIDWIDSQIKQHSSIAGSWASWAGGVIGGAFGKFTKWT